MTRGGDSGSLFAGPSLCPPDRGQAEVLELRRVALVAEWSEKGPGPMTLPREELDAWGFTWLPDLELPAQISDTGGELPVRDVLRSASSPALRELASAPQMLAGASSLLGGRAFPVRAHLFVKSPSRSWGVPWHQDRVVAVERRARLRRLVAQGGSRSRAGAGRCAQADGGLAAPPSLVPVSVGRPRGDRRHPPSIA